MAQKKDPNQKGSGAKKHRRSYKRFDGRFSTDVGMTRYRSRHNIPAGRRKDNHAKGVCPVHNR